MPLQYLPILYADRLRVMKKHLKVRKPYLLLAIWQQFHSSVAILQAGVVVSWE